MSIITKRSMSTKEYAHALLPYSMHQRIVGHKCKFSEQDEHVVQSQMALYPPSLDTNKIVNEELDKCIAFLPYCAKPMVDGICPTTLKTNTRKNKMCIKVLGGKCEVNCSLGKMADVLMKHGFTKDQIFIIDSTSNLIPWLIQKKKEGYKYFMPGVGCKYGVSYALDFMGKKLGFSGCIIFLDDHIPGDTEGGVCRHKRDFLAMEGVDKGKRTKIADESIALMDQILSGKYKNQHAMHRERKTIDKLQKAIPLYQNEG